MALVAKKSMTGTAKRDPEKYIGNVDDDLITLFIAMRSAPQVTKGIVAPASAPRQIGDIYIDTVALKCYMATGIASSADFKILN